MEPTFASNRKEKENKKPILFENRNSNPFELKKPKAKKVQQN